MIKDFREKNKIINVDCSEEDKKNGGEICKERKTNFNDTIHAVIAKRMKADYLVTRNIQDFIKLQDLIKIVYPENL